MKIPLIGDHSGVFVTKNFPGTVGGIPLRSISSGDACECAAPDIEQASVCPCDVFCRLSGRFVMKAFGLAASSIALALLLQAGCSSNSDQGAKANIGGTGGGDTGGSGGGTGGRAMSGTDGAAAGTSGKGTPDAAPDAASGGMPDGAVTSDATSQGGAGGDGGGRPDDAGGAADAGPVGADTWDTFAKGFFSTYCISCHNDDKNGDATRDYHVMANVMKEKAEIACGVAKSAADAAKRGCSGFPPARQFPVGSGPRPSDADRDRLLRWIDSGTP